VTTSTPILVVSSSPTLGDVLSFALTQEGYRVQRSKDERLEPDRVASCEPSMVIFAPAGYSRNPCSAIEPLRIHRRTSSIPVLVCGAETGEESEALIQQLGCERLDLPFDLDELYGAIGRLLGQRALAADRCVSSGEASIRMT
jgi:DNA-binding response OmpR family regulator